MIKLKQLLTEKTVRLSTMKDANFEPGQFVQLMGKKGMVKLDKKSVHSLAKIIRQMHGKKGMGWSFTQHEGKLTEASPYKTASRNELAMYISQLSNTIKGTKDGKMLNLLKKTKKEVEKELKSRKTNEGKLEEKAKRDYKAEYKKFQSSPKSKKYRAELNKYNRKKGTYGNGDGKDASHKGGKIAGFEKESVNRGRREKSRLKKEQKINESQLLKLANNVIKTKTEEKGMSLVVAHHIINTYNSYKKSYPKLAKQVANLPVNVYPRTSACFLLLLSNSFLMPFG